MNLLALADLPFRRPRPRSLAGVVAGGSATGTTALEEALARNDPEGVLREVCSLGVAGRHAIDDVAQQLIALLAKPELWSSDLAGYVLNFFVFWSPHLSPRSKRDCASFLAAYGDRFAGAHSSYVVGELRSQPSFRAASLSA